MESVIFNPTDEAKMKCGIFKRIQIVTQPLGGSFIAWELFSNFKAPGPFHFYADFGRSGTTEWEPLSSDPVVDACFTVDPARRYYDHLADFSYRVRLVLPNLQDNEGNCTVHISQPQQANGLWSKRDWLLAREIARKEYLYQRKRTNLTAVGILLKRRRWGVVCEDCKEFDTGEVQARWCPNCYGTGFEGGFFKGVDFTVTMDAPWQREFKRHPQKSMTNNIIRHGRAVAYPYVDSDDIYVRKDNGERYYVHAIRQEAEVGGIPVVVSIELRLAPSTDLAYTVPLTGGSYSSDGSLVEHSSNSSDTCNVNAGLTNLEAW